MDNIYKPYIYIHIYRVFRTGGWGEGSPPTSRKITHYSPPPPPNQIFILSTPKVNPPPTKYTFSRYNPRKTSFLALVTPVTIFSFEKGSNHQNHSSGSHHLVKQFPPEVFTTF